jgi:putative transposase
MIERFFRSLKEECVWLHLFEGFEDAQRAVVEWLEWYNTGRPHQSLGYLSPSEFRAQQLSQVA